MCVLRKFVGMYLYVKCIKGIQVCEGLISLRRISLVVGCMELLDMPIS